MESELSVGQTNNGFCGSLCPSRPLFYRGDGDKTKSSSAVDEARLDSAADFTGLYKVIFKEKVDSTRK